MKFVVLVDRDAFEKALAQARASEAPALKGLAAPVSGKLQGLISEAWDAIERALRETFLLGKERAAAAIDAAVAVAEDLAQKAAGQARDFQDEIVRRLRQYESAFVESTLARVHSRLMIGDRPLLLQTVEVSQKLVLSGSLKATITEICSLSTGGETTIVTRYASAANQD